MCLCAHRFQVRAENSLGEGPLSPERYVYDASHLFNSLIYIADIYTLEVSNL
jgi:hypothetical protein